MATETQGAESASGLPQLNFDTFGNQIFWLLIALVAIYLILSRVALPRISSVLAERQGTITNDLTAAEDLKAKAAEAEEAYKKALADARAEAQKIIAETKASIKDDLDKANEEADAKIAAQCFASKIEHVAPAVSWVIAGEAAKARGDIATDIQIEGIPRAFVV